VEAWDRDLKHKLADGSLWAVDNQIDPSTGTVRLKAVFPNEDTALYPNQFVNARLLVDTLRNAVIIPVAAIQRSPQSAYVYVVTPDSTVEIRDVVVGRVEGEVAAIAKGLAAGEVVVTEGMDKLPAWTPVFPPRERRRREIPSMNPSAPFIQAPHRHIAADGGAPHRGRHRIQQLPVSALPQVDYPTIQVVTFYPGASPEVMASAVTARWSGSSGRCRPQTR